MTVVTHQRLVPPVAAQHRRAVTRHGERVEDDYAWLRAENWQEVTRDPATLDPEIRAYLEAENAYAEAMLEPVTDLRQRLFAEMKARIKEDDATVPEPDGPWAYYTRYVTGGQHPIFCRQRRDGKGAEQVLLDGDKEGAGEAFFRVGTCRHSPDHRLAAYSVDLTGSEHFTIRIKDLATGALSPETIEDATANLVWGNDGRTLYYTRLDDNLRPKRIYRHTVGADPATDPLLYAEEDARFYVRLTLTEDRRFVLIHAFDHSDTAEIWTIDAGDPFAEPKLFAARETGVDYDVTSYGDRFFVRTNAGDAIDYKIAATPLDRTGREHWADLVPHREGRLILDMLAFKDRLVRLEREAGLPRIVVRRLSDGDEHAIAFAEAAYSLGIDPGLEFDTATLRFDYSSLTTPHRTYDYDMATRERVLRKEAEVPSGHDPADYVTERLMATSHDGAEVPVSLLYRKHTPLDGTAPLLLYGYGSYGISIPAGFGANRLSLVDRGFVFALAHIRGGTDKGYGWYLDGKLMNKRNSFLDFIAAGEHLAAKRYTRRGNIVAHGGSAGGLLVGAAANMAPDLFRAIIAEVPFVDVVNTICDAELPLTPPEWSEWGNPIESAEAYRYIHSYSPYDNVTAQAYPAIFATGGVSDPRVTYWEPAKWVAKLRALKTDRNPILMRINMEAGHGGAAGRFDRLEEIARLYAFVLMVCGLAD